MFVEVELANLPPMQHITFFKTHELKREKHQHIQIHLKQPDENRTHQMADIGVYPLPNNCFN
jgi:hypothetical protein